MKDETQSNTASDAESEYEEEPSDEFYGEECITVPCLLYEDDNELSQVNIATKHIVAIYSKKPNARFEDKEFWYVVETTVGPFEVCSDYNYASFLDHVYGYADIIDDDYDFEEASDTDSDSEYESKTSSNANE